MNTREYNPHRNTYQSNYDYMNRTQYDSSTTTNRYNKYDSNPRKDVYEAHDRYDAEQTRLVRDNVCANCGRRY